MLFVVNCPHIFVFVEFTRNVGWSSCALIEMVILIYAQLDHSLFEAARLETKVSEFEGMFHELRLWMSCVSLSQYFAHLLC